MDRYKKTKPKSQYSVDGFLVTGPRKRYQEITSQQKATPQSPRLNQLDNFDRSDGFHGQQTPRMKMGGDFESTSAQDDFEVSRTATAGINLKRPNAPALHTSKRRPFGRNSKDTSKKKHKKGKLRTFVKVSAILLVAGLSIFGFIFGKAWWDAQKALNGGGSALAMSKDVDPNSLNGEGDGRINILLLGKGGDQHEGGQLTDTLMIASVDPINNGVVMLSIPRDLWVKPDNLWPMKINAVYNSAKEQALYKNSKDKAAAEKAGIDTTEQVIEQYLDVKINYYAMVDFTAFEEAVNILGGITVNLPEPYSDPTMKIGKKYLSLPAGPNQLDGGTALGLARSRYGAERGDFDRGRNQQLVIIGIKDKLLSMGTFVNPLKISQLITTFGNRVQTNFSTDDLMRLYELSKNIPNENITNVDLAMKGEAVVQTGSIGGQSVVYPIAGVDDFSEVKKFVRLKLKDSFIIKENPTIIVLNASGKSGAATKRAEELKSYGYNVIQVADAPISNVPVTQLIDTTKGAKKYTKRYLELRFNTQAVSGVDGLDTTPYIADYIVVIGQNG
jgi:LCP family protein required for cell wall assembly